MYSRFTLPNGLRVLTARMAHVRSVSITFFFGVGARYEPDEIAGMSHFIEHMLFKGSERYPTAQAISESIEGVGGVLDAATDKELTVFSARVASRHFDRAIDLLADMVRHPRFDPLEMEKERRVIIEELSMYKDSPSDWVGVLADEMFWPALPLGREVAGTRETVQALSREAMAEYHRAYYVPNDLVVGVVGDVTSEQVMEAVTRLLGDWEPGTPPRWMPSPAPEGEPRVTVQKRSTEQTNLCLMLSGIAHADPDYYVLVLLNAILGDGMSSRLFLEVRERLGLAYDVSSSPAHYHDTGAFVVYAGVDPRRAAAAVEAILAELRRMRDEPVTEAELARAKEYAKGRMALRLEDTGSVASWLAGQEMLLDEIHELDDVMARLDAVTREDIQRVAARIVRPDCLCLAVIGPHSSARTFEALLRV